jgi:enamine deaminase RidA (YjgF/YER057c/UK114 family)
MKKEIITTQVMPKSPGYSQAIKVGNRVFLAGTTALDPRTKTLESLSAPVSDSGKGSFPQFSKVGLGLSMSNVRGVNEGRFPRRLVLMG